jgi:two-component system, sensor histidine kinase and response regulator
MNTLPTILIVDDDDNNLMVLGQLLKKNHYRIALAKDAKTCLEILDSTQIEMILMDVLMPDMNGFDLCKSIKSDNRYNQIPVLFLSAITETEEMAKGFQNGAADFIIKPFNSRILLSRINTHLSLYYKTLELERLNRNLEKIVEERTLQLHHANEELVVLNEAKTEFLNIISHEIRTPLNGILGATHMLAQDKPNSSQEKVINMMKTSVERLEQYTLNALLYTNIRTKTYPIFYEKTDIWKPVEIALQLTKHSFEKNNIQIIKKQGINPPIMIDVKLVSKSLMYILNNAIRYSRENSEIVIQTSVENGKLFCDIISFGETFSEPAIKKLFNLYVAGEKFMDHNEGLELALSKLIMDAHHGDIYARNHDSGICICSVFKL